MYPDEAFVRYVIEQLVDHPDHVTVTRSVDEMGVLITLSIHKEDMGKVIGRQGATAKAIRTLLRVVGMKNEARVNLKILEPEGEPVRRRIPPVPHDRSAATDRERFGI